MKLKDHVLRQQRNIPLSKNGKRYICRVLRKGSPTYWLIAKHHGCDAEFFMDLHSMVYLRASRRYVIGQYQPIFEGRRWFEFPTFEAVILWLKEKGFKILPKIHRKSKLTQRKGWS